MATTQSLKILCWETVRLKPDKRITKFVGENTDVVFIVRGRWKAYLSSRVGNAVTFSNRSQRVITVDIFNIDRFENDSIHSILKAKGYTVSYADNCS